MPIAKVQLPDGRIAKFDVPDGTTPEQVTNFALQNIESFSPQTNQQQTNIEQQLKQPTSQIPDLVGLGQTGPRRFVQQPLQGATFGFGEEVSGILGALGAKGYDVASSFLTGKEPLLEDYTISELAQQAQQQQRADIAAQMEQRPLESLGLQTGGGLTTSIGGAATATGKAVLNNIARSTLKGKMAKSAAFGATTGGLSGFGYADQDRLEGAITGGIVGGAFGAAIPAAATVIGATPKAAKSIRDGVKARAGEQLDEAADVLRRNANKLYKQFKKTNSKIKKDSLIKLVDNIEKGVTSTGKLNTKIHGDTLSVLSDIKKAADLDELSLEELDQFRQLFGESVSKNVNNIGRLTPDGLKSSRAIKALDKSVSRLSGKDIIGTKESVTILNNARAEWARFGKFERVADIIKKADGDPNRLKNLFKRFVINPKNLRGFSKAQKEALKIAASNTTNEKVLKGLGKFGFDLGTSLTPGNTFLPSLFIGAQIGGGIQTAPLVAAGTLARGTQKALARGKAEQVLRTIEGVK